PIMTMQRYLCTPRLSWDFLTLAEPDRWNEYFAVADLPRAGGADFEVGARRYGLFSHDFRRVPVDAWFGQVADRALSENPAAPKRPAPQLLVLSQPEFEQAVRQALHDWRRPDLLRRNPLMRTRVVCDRGGAEPDVAELDTVLRDAVDALADDPRDDKMVRAVDRTYLRPAATQEAAAQILGLPFSTYRRHLTQGVAQIVSWLWDREIYGRQE
ncbi:MAG: ATP-binding protein, partial [Rhodococcus sp. (in: high G+C Gram-positive bacteria)]